ncbi:hypothetical protein QCA50_019763 [Cerrena zonata]|uniref:F-box domain-containing protein n=1 Tax=Cerrena zonata TaxID=2478898 RepID=A0AAW0FJ88_9APHY
MAFINEVEQDQAAHPPCIPPDHEDTEGFCPQSEGHGHASASREQHGSTTAYSILTTLQYYRTPRIPLELHKEVIDWIVADVNLKGPTLWPQITLLRCMLVCHLWYTLAHRHLYSNINLEEQDLSKLKASLKKKPALVQSIRAFCIQCERAQGNHIFSISALLVSWKLTNLQYLEIWGMDLQAESPWLCKVAAHLKNVHYLGLDIKRCTSAQLIRFINSFQSLSKLSINYTFIESKDHTWPRPCKLSTFSLTCLMVGLTPGISTVLDWLLKADLVCLQQIDVMFYHDDVDSGYEKIVDLFNHCGNTLTELTISIYTMSTKDIPKYGKKL